MIRGVISNHTTAVVASCCGLPRRWFKRQGKVCACWPPDVIVACQAHGVRQQQLCVVGQASGHLVLTVYCTAAIALPFTWHPIVTLVAWCLLMATSKVMKFMLNIALRVHGVLALTVAVAPGLSEKFMLNIALRVHHHHHVTN
jgi:hypothetical protein